MKKTIEQIEAMTRQPGFIYTLALILLRDLFFHPGDTVDINWHEHLNFQVITFLVGLLIKSEINLSFPTEEESARLWEEAYRLFDQLHNKHHEHFIEQLQSRMKTGVSVEDSKGDYRRAFGSGMMVAEPIFYGGSGAYDFQYQEFAAKKYADDSEWIRHHVGIDISDMCSVARSLKKFQQDKYNALHSLPREEFSKLCAAALSIFCFEAKDLRQFGTETIGAFVKAFSLIPGTVNASLHSPGQFK